MGVECTIFSVAASDVPAEPSLPTSTDDLLRYHSDRGDALERLEQHPRLDLGKAWDAVHFSLGQHDGDHPLAFIESGGTDVEALSDGEMSAARYFDPTAVLDIARLVVTVTRDDLARNFARRDTIADPDQLYPSGLRPFELEDVLRAVRNLRTFLADVVAAKRGIVVHTSG